jgi:hypothetical protein
MIRTSALQIITEKWRLKLTDRHNYLGAVHSLQRKAVYSSGQGIQVWGPR